MSDLRERKELGQIYLGRKQIEEAENIYVSVLKDNPQDSEAYFALGQCYLAAGDYETAILLYTQASKYEPTNLDYQKQRSRAIELMVKAASARSKAQNPGADAIPTDPQTVMGLLERISGSVVTENEVTRAAEMLEHVVNSPHPAQTVSEYLDEIDALLPALLELNIRQARADGRPELANALQTLLNNIILQIGTRTIETSYTPPEVPLPITPQIHRVLFMGPAGYQASLRQVLPAEALSGFGCEVTVATQFPSDFQQRFDVVIAHHPHGNPNLLPGLAACSAARIPVILDMELDFEQMPVVHPEYVTLSLGTPTAAKAYATAMLLADQICVPNETLAAPLRTSGQHVRVIPDGWSRSNELWQKPSAVRHSLNLGWIGQSGQLDDISQIRRHITRLMREFSQINLVIVGDALVYQLFESLPESRVLFLPPVNMEDYPYLLGQIDILLMPLRNIPFNQSLSDQRLMEAGVRSIPWVASPIPAFIAWGAGGLIANSLDEWHTHIRQLVLDSNLRYSLGREGHQKAEEREMGRLGRLWMDMILSCTKSKV